jgi:fructokinase
MRRYALIEAGGSKFICAVADDRRMVVATRRVPTSKPEYTLAAARQFFHEHAGSFAAGGIASFGPIDLDPSSPTYAQLRKTPKPGWSGVDVRIALPEGLPAIGIDTDVNAACLAEAKWGAGVGRRTVAYATIGTGIGVGVVHDGVPIRGASHAEMGHIPVARDRTEDSFVGRCPYHGDCLEGVACGPAIQDRWGSALDQLPRDHFAHELEASYVAQLCVSLIYSFAPDIIILGGGVMSMPGLIEKTRAHTLRLLGNYWTPALNHGDLRNYIVQPALDDSGLWGALILAQSTARAIRTRPG